LSKSFFEDDPCEKCGTPLEPEDRFFITEIGRDLYWKCPACGLKYDVAHECHTDFCSEVLTVAK
jgi:DNA-directed RNA polymerase subunit RPC12/RpoP